MSLTVTNVRNNSHAKLATVKRWIDQCVCDWVEFGKSYRELTTQERLERMALRLERSGKIGQELAKSRKPGYLPAINPSGEIERMPRSEVWTNQLKYECLVQARELASLYMFEPIK